jgi:hypothetical protein
VSDEQPEERPRDWMEVWYETGEVTRQPPPPLSPGARKRVLDIFDDLTEEQNGLTSE